ARMPLNVWLGGAVTPRRDWRAPSSGTPLPEADHLGGDRCTSSDSNVVFQGLFRTCDNPVPVGEVLDRGYRNGSGVTEQGLDRRFLVVADLHGEAPARLQHAQDLRGEHAVVGQAVRAAFQGDAGLVVAHLRLQRLDDVGGDV